VLPLQGKQTEPLVEAERDPSLPHI
jgi:hypothetical protein